MKRILTFLFLTISISLSIRAVEIEVDRIHYELDDTTMEATLSYAPKDISGDIILPSQVESEGNIYPVVSIKEDAFYNCGALTSIIIPEFVTSIGKYAFGNCLHLTKVTIPDCVATLGNYAFFNCISLSEIKLPELITEIDDYTFYNCESLTEIIIPNNVKTIRNDAFADCKNLENVTISNSVFSIGMYAFSSCYSLKSIVIPDSVVSLGMSAFESCDLRTITLGNSLITIEERCFDSNEGLEEVYSYSIMPPPCHGEGNRSPFNNILLSYVTLHVPYGSNGWYMNADYWDGFGTIIDDLPREGLGSSNGSTGLEEISKDYPENIKVYNLSGQLIITTTNKADLNSLPKGIYIIDEGKVRTKLAI